jgi:hypothetical protein
MQTKEYRAAIYERGRQALKQIPHTASLLWLQWVEIGESLMMARTEAFEIGGTNDLKSYSYKKVFREIITRERLDEKTLHSQTRKALFAVMENLPAIVNWREKLEPHQLAAWNSPDAVLRHWKATFPAPLKAPKPTKESPDPTGMLSDLAEHAVKDDLDAKDLEIVRLKQKIIALVQENNRLRGLLGMEPGPNDDLDDLLPLPEPSTDTEER